MICCVRGCDYGSAVSAQRPKVRTQTFRRRASCCPELFKAGRSPGRSNASESLARLMNARSPPDVGSGRGAARAVPPSLRPVFLSGSPRALARRVRSRQPGNRIRPRDRLTGSSLPRPLSCRPRPWLAIRRHRCRGRRPPLHRPSGPHGGHRSPSSRHRSRWQAR